MLYWIVLMEFMHQFNHPNNLSIYLLVWLCLHPPIHWSGCASIHPSIGPTVHPSTHPLVRLCIHPLIHWSDCASIHPSIGPIVHSSTRPLVWLCIHPLIHWSGCTLIHPYIHPYTLYLQVSADVMILYIHFPYVALSNIKV